MSTLPTVPVVLRYADGRMEKCRIGPYFSHSLKVIQVIQEDKSVLTVPIQDLKAVFFVEELDGKGHPEENWKSEDPGALKAGKTVCITFLDGEKIRGKVLGDLETGVGFFLFPMEKESNNRKVFIVRSATQEVTLEE